MWSSVDLTDFSRIWLYNTSDIQINNMQKSRPKAVQNGFPIAKSFF